MTSFWKSILRLSTTQRYRPLILIVVFGVVGAGIVLMSQASTQTVSIEPEFGTTSLGAKTGSDPNASNDTYLRFGAPQATTFRRFFADDASWNKTITQMGGAFTSINQYAERLWDYGGGTFQGAAPPGTFFLSLKDYSVPMYDIKDANTTARLYQVGWSQNQQVFSHTGLGQGVSVPWNENWKPGTGNDRILAIVDYDLGKVYELWVVGEPSYGCIDFVGPNAQAGFDINNPTHKCIGGVETYSNLWTAKEGSTVIGRGMGINKLALVVRAEEVESGNIGHALPLTTANPMFGPDMVNPAYDPLQSGAGTTLGFYMKPATRLEHRLGTTIDLGSGNTTSLTDAQRAKTVPSGMRFGVNLTETDITNWLNQKGYTGAKRTTAQTFARGFRDYGAVVAETGGWGIGIETDGVIGPSKPIWERLGLYNSQTDTLSEISFDGLITRDRLYVVKPPL